jgi:hypothetical protein
VDDRPDQAADSVRYVMAASRDSASLKQHIDLRQGEAADERRQRFQDGRERPALRRIGREQDAEPSADDTSEEANQNVQSSHRFGLGQSPGDP